MADTEGSAPPMLVVLERACAALAALVREEYPDGHTLAEIADIWGIGVVTPEQVDALRILEATDDTEPAQ